MTQHLLPDDLRRWIAGRLPGADTVTDVSWARKNSRVRRVAAGADAVFVKISPTTREYECEVRGYAHATRALCPDTAPRLIAADPDLRALMSSPLPGRVVRDLPLTRATERRVHEQAGRLLRHWHDHSPSPRARDRAAIRAAVAEQAQEAAICLEVTAAHLDDAQRAVVRCMMDELPRLAETMPMVYRHGDHATRNWLFDATRNSVGLIDFETADHGIVADEFVWLYGALWSTRPDLKAAHFTGYGRLLSDDEERFLLLLTARLSVSYLRSGLTKDRPDLIERGRLVLARMAHQAR
ncbi:aminoglycoside phosphotransferase family protein [Embleya sp. NPDC056538]|uniref:aminoglycoside phosphotransferase family protein n=1 Tax=Embleya sp. NPDC056538 TaxID=3345858 RepID=UPI0036BB1FAF